MADPYADGLYHWWHLSRVPPELLAAELCDCHLLPAHSISFLTADAFSILIRGKARAYSAEAERVLRPDGRMLLRACLNCGHPLS